MDIHTHSQCRHSHSPALCHTGQSLLKTDYTNKLSRHPPYLSLFRALKIQADNFANLCVLQTQLSAAAKAVQGSEEGSCMHCPYISSSAVPWECQGRAWPCPSCWDTPGGAGFWEAQAGQLPFCRQQQGLGRWTAHQWWQNQDYSHMVRAGFQRDQEVTKQRSKVRQSFEDPFLKYRCPSSI